MAVTVHGHCGRHVINCQDVVNRLGHENVITQLQQMAEQIVLVLMKNSAQTTISYLLATKMIAAISQVRIRINQNQFLRLILYGISVLFFIPFAVSRSPRPSWIHIPFLVYQTQRFWFNMYMYKWLMVITTGNIQFQPCESVCVITAKHREGHLTRCWRQVIWVVKASGLGAEGPRFDPWQQHLVQLSISSKRWRGGHGKRGGTKVVVEAQKVKAENTISVGHCVIPLGKGLVPHCSGFEWDYKPRSILATHAFDLAQN